MSIAAALLPEFDEEMASTRRVLERVPDDRGDWAPHPKSMKFGRLAVLVAEMPGWVVSVVNQAVLAVPKDHQPPPFEGRDKTLALFDQNVARARQALAEAPDSAFDGNWSLLWGGEKVIDAPKTSVYRTTVMSHLVHHRAQLMGYLRLNDIPVPGVYGPSADEQ